MRTKIKSAIAAFTVLISVAATAQVADTVKVIKETQVVRDTIKETKIMHDTIVKYADEPKKQEDNKAERPPLRRGEFGVRYMPTFSSFALRTYNGEVVQGDLTLSHGYGVMLGANLSKNVGIQAEVNYLEITQKYKDRNLNRQVDVAYLNVPVLLSVNTDKRRIVNLNFVAGPQFGFNVGSSIKTTGSENTETVRAVVGASGTDIGLAYGTGLEIALNRMHTLRLDLGYRGFYGLVDGNADQTSNPDTYNVIVKASRKSHAAYLGLTACF
jgi:opacity protein-like surface antigen